MPQLSTLELTAVGLFLALVGIITYKLYPGTTRQRLDIAGGVILIAVASLYLAHELGLAIAAAAAMLVLLIYLCFVPTDSTRSWVLTRGIGVILFGIMLYSLLD